MVLVPLSFSLIRSRELAREVSNVLPVLESTGAKMLTLEAEGRILADKVVEHVLTCFQSRDPMVLRPVIETEEAAKGSIQEAAKIVAAQFQRLAEDS
jgi:hypothetical protein